MHKRDMINRALNSSNEYKAWIDALLNTDLTGYWWNVNHQVDGSEHTLPEMEELFHDTSGREISPVVSWLKFITIVLCISYTGIILTFRICGAIRVQYLLYKSRRITKHFVKPTGTPAVIIPELTIKFMEVGGTFRNVYMDGNKAVGYIDMVEPPKTGFVPECAVPGSLVKPVLDTAGHFLLQFLNEEGDVQGHGVRVYYNDVDCIVTANHVGEGSKYVRRYKSDKVLALPKPVYVFNDICVYHVNKDVMSSFGFKRRKCAPARNGIKSIISVYKGMLGKAYGAVERPSPDRKYPFDFKHNITTYHIVSGSPILNKSNEVIGIHRGAYTTEGVNVAAALEPVLRLAFPKSVNHETYVERHEELFSFIEEDEFLSNIKLRKVKRSEVRHYEENNDVIVWNGSDYIHSKGAMLWADYDTEDEMDEPVLEKKVFRSPLEREVKLSPKESIPSPSTSERHLSVKSKYLALRKSSGRSISNPGEVSNKSVLKFTPESTKISQNSKDLVIQELLTSEEFVRALRTVLDSAHAPDQKEKGQPQRSRRRKRGKRNSKVITPTRKC